uniref:Sulfurtransferase n=1 Tax=Marinobacter nauticus TaxID=2743 RepID=A0A455VZV1_MARNT|nr:hypothetical protein YBY_02420 [Marinobacter nauticus]
MDSSGSVGIQSLSDSFKTTDFVAAAVQGDLQEHVVIIDTRSAAEYQAGHIPGAINFDLKEYYRDKSVNGLDIDFAIPSESEFVAIADQLGITPATRVIAYGHDYESGYAPRLAWTFQHYGHANAHSVDGGIEKWQFVDGRAVEAGEVEPTPNAVSYQVSRTRALLATKDDVSSKVNDPNVIILDIRAPGEHAGIINPDSSNDRLGHVPGAEFVHWEDLLTDNSEGIQLPDSSRKVQVLKSEFELRSFLLAKGITPEKTIIPYGQNGTRSSFVTQVLLGLGYQVQNYDGSWYEWSREQDIERFPVSNDTDFLMGLLDTQASLADYFISTEDLEAKLAEQNPNLILLDVRGRSQYEAGHILGAINVSAGAFTETREIGFGVTESAFLLNEDDFESKAEELGITNQSEIVVYGTGDVSETRVVWSFKHYGHTNVVSLDGGFPKWSGEDREISTTVTTPVASSPETFTIANGGLIAFADDLRTAIGNDDVIFHDTRRFDEYLEELGGQFGPGESGYNSGHLPDAIWLEWSDLTTTDPATGARVLKSRDELLSQLFAEGITPDKLVIPYCQSGYRSSFSSNVLKGLGYTRALNYDGSWREWDNLNRFDDSFQVE